MASSKQTDEIFDEFIADMRDGVYEKIGYRYIARLIMDTPYKSNLAFAICEKLEQGSIYEAGLYDQFPAYKRRYNQRLKEYDKARNPIVKQLTALKKEDNEILTRIEEAEDPDRKNELEQRHNEIRDRQLELTIERDALKQPVYRSVYDSERTVFKQPKTSKRKSLNKKDVVKKEDWDYLADYYQQKAAGIDPEEEKAVFSGLDVLKDAMGMSDDAIALLKFFSVVERGGDDVGLFIEEITGKKQTHFNAITSRMTGISYDRVNALLAEDSMLLSSGLVEIDKDHPDIPMLSSFVRDILLDRTMDKDGIRSRLSGRAVTTALDWQEDFNNLGDYGRDIEKLVQHAIDERKSGRDTPGPVIWFTGEPDTGKTSAAIALVQHLAKTNPDLEIRLIGEKINHNQDEQSGLTQVQSLKPEDRMSQIMLSVGLSRGNPNVIFLVEEPESFMPKAHSHNEGDEGPIERVIVQRLFEQNPAAALIFTTNHADEIHPAVRRRGIEVEFTLPGRAQRAEIIKRVLQKHEIELPEEKIDTLAKTYQVPAGKWASAIPMAKITADDPDDPEQIFQKISTWVERQAERDHGNAQHIKPAHIVSNKYDLNLVNLTGNNNAMGVDRFIEGIENVARKSGGFEILLEGWPGTGKSEMGWMIGERLDQEVMYIQRSDILNMFVGGSEANLARMFKSALDRDAILMIDEVETLVPRRGGQNANHENSLVAEFLSQMDRFQERGGRIIVTTNHADQVDPAVERRFEDRLAFDFLRSDQVLYAWDKFFGASPPDHIKPELQKMQRLTPSDFARTAKVASRTDMITKPDLLLTALQNRERDKPKDHQPRRKKTAGTIGFVRPEEMNGHHSNGNGHNGNGHEPLPPIVVPATKAASDLGTDLTSWRVRKSEGKKTQYRPFGTI